ncbi:MAG TPA: alpha/beta hydrolase [Gemmatimonadaceae bacterium]|nr:alpha/beta hydrolase [Gemmatimonadaceae bacterium]
MERYVPYVALVLSAALTTISAGAQAPADIGPVSADVSEIPYPYPVSWISFQFYGQNVRMAYMDVKPTGAANGRTVVLLHGFNFFGEAWAGTIKVLIQEGFRVIVPDQIGFGRSSKPFVPYTLNDMAINTRRLLDSLGVDRAAIVGHSMGGMVASRFAMAYPSVTSHVVLVNQIGLTDARPGRAPRTLDDAYRSDTTRPTPARTYEQVRQTITRYFVTWKPEYEKYVRIHWGWTLSPDWTHFSHVRAALAQMLTAETVVYDWQHITSKALVIGGARDTPEYADQARHVAESIPGAQLELIDNVGHVPQFEAPEIFFPKLVAFLRSPAR